MKKEREWALQISGGKRAEWTSTKTKEVGWSKKREEEGNTRQAWEAGRLGMRVVEEIM